ncbi:hypothetical protein J1N35_037481, partial [Gossypium stocksii]
GFLLKDEPYVGHDELVFLIVEKHNWSKFCLHPGDVVGKVVREFYANSLDSPFIYVRGATIDKGKATEEELEKSTFVELEKDAEEGKEETNAPATIPATTAEK